MSLHQSRKCFLAIRALASLAILCLVPLPGRSAGFGRIVGTVADPQGTPLMGATVIIIGPALAGLASGGGVMEHVMTDAHGKFAIERLIPGWYTLKVTAATRLPMLRNGVRVEAGGSIQQNFVLGDILTPIRVQIPSSSISSWGEDWKWALRTASVTRPVLRFQPATQPSAKSKSKGNKIPLPSSQHLLAMSPGATRGRALAGDPGMGSILAYVRPLSENADLLVAGSMGAGGMQTSSLATMLRRDALKGDPEELALVVHQLNFSDGVPLAPGDSRAIRSHAQALVASYAQTRRILDRLALTSGFEVDYLNAGGNVMSARPFLQLAYQPSASQVVSVRYGGARMDAGGSLLDRIGALTAFPRITMWGYQARLETLDHSEVAYERTLSPDSRLEVAAYRDALHNAAVWGFGNGTVLARLAGNFLPNPAVDGVMLNAGNFTSSGVRASFTRKLKGQAELAVIYSLGDALAAVAADEATPTPMSNLRASLRRRQTQAVGARVSTHLPVSKTYIVGSYEWLPNGRVTAVDPVGQANLQMQPYLGIQIRQPLPNLAFLPARIEALADFQNLLAQGYVPVARSGEDTLIVTPAYRSFRGGFSVQF